MCAQTTDNFHYELSEYFVFYKFKSFVSFVCFPANLTIGSKLFLIFIKKLNHTKYNKVNLKLFILSKIQQLQYC